jgi:cbb3-type cytochrome oxidase maturation protein
MVVAVELSTWVFAFLLVLILGLAAWLLLFWGIRSGQFRNSDDVADRMLELERNERAQPVREGKGR